MRSDRSCAWVALAALALVAAPLAAQDALSGVGPGTQVSKIQFRFLGEHTVQEKHLRPLIALTARGGLVGIRRALGFLPFVSPVGDHPFRPVELQRDVVRIRNVHHRNGFLDAKVDYDVSYKAKDDLVEVTFVIEEGPPLLLRGVRFVAADSDAAAPPPAPAVAPAPEIAPEIAPAWQGFTATEAEYRGRLGESERRGIADRTTRWLRNRGYPFAVAEADVLVDTAAHRADVMVRVRPGLRARIREIAVRGNETVPARELTRQLPLEPGDWYDAAQLEGGRARLTQLSIVRLALLSVPRESADDSSVVVQLGVTENPPRIVRGEAGIASSGGLVSRVDWTHRSFLGGVRSFTVSATAQTGLVALESPAERRYRLAVTIFQPYVGSRFLSAAGGPFVEYRDDLRDRSQAVGFEGTLVYATSPLRSLSLSYGISHREILDFGFGDDLAPIDYLPLLGLADSASVGSLGTIVNRSALTLDASWGKLDDFSDPRKGYVIRPRVSVTLPGFNTSEYVLLDLGASGFLPLTNRIGFTVRGSAGRIVPFGRSVRDTDSESPFVSLLRLRDVTFSAGGTRDVRGWGSQLVGPKLPEVRFRDEDGVSTPFAERYSPIGGLARVQTSAEVQLPLPGFDAKWQTFLFLDGAKVWTPDDRFSLGAGELDQDRFFLGTGAGIGYETVVGAVQVSLGYKLNPSALDVRDPDAVLQALREGRSLETVPTDSRRRLQLHFSIGATF
ncbi:MAG: BamA/TamA family outer membrane protein [Gemmatimonadales bacterium]|nr:BamA/TamA family outer membrane protein [Gemmatimonadales bacterium]